jgi:hypothetical protein
MPAEIVHLLCNPQQYVAVVRNGEIYIALRHAEPASVTVSIRSKLTELAAAVFAGVATGWISDVG